MKNRKKIIICSLISIVIIFIIIKIILGNVQDNKLKTLLELVNCTYYKTTSSSENGYYKDIYVSIPEPPVSSEYNISNQNYYETIIKYVANGLKYENYRIIDEEQDIIIRIRYNEDGVKYSINGDTNYYETTKIKQGSEKRTEQNNNITQLEVKSTILEEIINNKWKYITNEKVIGTLDSVCDNYDYYFDEGYRIKTNTNKIFNIIFTKQYTNEIFENIKTGMTIPEIVSVLGEPTYKNEFGTESIGYKNNDFYVFFGNEEISIYKIQDYEEQKNDTFVELVKEVLESNDFDKFVSSLTENYPDYDKYEVEDGELTLTYPQRGFKIVFKKDEKNAIIIYNNYKGKITDDISIDEIDENTSLPQYISYVDGNAVYEAELMRIGKEQYIRSQKNEIDENRMIFNTSKLFNIITQNYQEFQFYSIDKNNVDRNFTERNLTQMYNITDNVFVYGKRNEGIYIYDVISNSKQLIINDKSDCNIKKIENNIIYYDNKKVELK